MGRGEGGSKLQKAWESVSLNPFPYLKTMTRSPSPTTIPIPINSALCLSAGGKGRVLVVVYCYRGADIRISSARVAEPHERREYEEER